MLVDIIIPTHNRPKMLVEALESLILQTYSNWRCYIAEDGRTSETMAALKPFLADSRFVYLPGEKSGRPTVPRNLAIRQGNGSLIAFLDDDDIWLPDKLACQLNFFKSHEKCVLQGANAWRWNGSSQKTDLPLYYKKLKFTRRPMPYMDMVKRNNLITSTVIARRSAIEQAGLFNEDKRLHAGEDFELWLRVAALGEVRFIDQPLALYREATASFYNTLSRDDDYRYKAYVLNLALKGTHEQPSPLQDPQNKKKAEIILAEIQFCLKRPRIGGRLLHNLLYKFSAKIK